MAICSEPNINPIHQYHNTLRSLIFIKTFKRPHLWLVRFHSMVMIQSSQEFSNFEPNLIITPCYLSMDINPPPPSTRPQTMLLVALCFLSRSCRYTFSQVLYDRKLEFATQRVFLHPLALVYRSLVSFHGTLNIEKNILSFAFINCLLMGFFFYKNQRVQSCRLHVKTQHFCKLGFHSSCDQNWFITSLLQNLKDHVTFQSSPSLENKELKWGQFSFVILHF